MLKKLLASSLLLAALQAQAQYLETFSSPNKGYLLNQVNDFSGVNWTMTTWANQPPAPFGRDSLDYFQTTAAGVLECLDLDQEVSWESPLLNTAAAPTVSLSVALTWAGFDADIAGNPCTEASLDYIKVQYSVDGGLYTTVPNQAGGSACATIGYVTGSPNAPFSGSLTVNQAGIPGGSTLRIRVCVNVNVNAEIVTIDNVSVPTAGVTLGCSAPALSTSVTNITCGGPNSGAIDLSVSGGTPGYTYKWSNGTNQQDLVNLPVGIYTVTVTDAASCTATATASVLSINFVANTQVGNATCTGASDGEIDLQVGGGTPPYKYSWSDLPNPGDPQDRTGLAPGTYTVTVADSGVCSATASATVGLAPAGPYLETFSIAGKGLLPGGTCGGPSAETCTNGSFAGVNWTIYSADNLMGIDADDYFQTTGGKLEGKDFDQIVCWESPALDINPPGAGVAFSVDLAWTGFDQEPVGPNPPDLIADHIDVEYRLDNGAWARVPNQTGGGLTGHTIVYINGAGNDLNGSKTVSVTGLSGGKLQIRVCGYLNSDVETISIDNVSAPSANALYCPVPQLSTSVTNVTCFGGSDGAINLSIEGGAPGYTFKWSNGAVTEDLNGIPAGPYVVTVTDNAGFTNVATATVSESAAIDATPTIKPISCFNGSDGEITATVSGGIPGYTYLWSTGSNTNTAVGLSSGAYSLTVTDSKGCTGTLVNVILSDPTAVAGSPVYDPFVCPGKETALTIDTIIGGNGAPYQYSVDNGVFLDPNFPFSLTAGAHVLTYVDRLGCESTQDIVIAEYPASNALILGPDMTCLGLPSTYNLPGAFSNYTWSASNSGTITQGQGTNAATVLWATQGGNSTLTATFTNANGCADTATLAVLVSICDGTAEAALPGVTVSPNPFGDVLTLRFERPVEAGTQLQLSDAQGRLVLMQQVQKETTRIETGNLPLGVYWLSVIEKSGHRGVWKLVKPAY